MIRVEMNGKQIGKTVASNRSMTIVEVVEYALSLSSIDDQDELMELYREGCEAICQEDGVYFVDLDRLEIIW